MEKIYKRKIEDVEQFFIHLIRKCPFVPHCYIENLRPLPLPSFVPGHEVLYLSGPGVVSGLQGKVGHGRDTQHQLSIAMSINLQEERNLKEYKLAVLLNGTTLRHRTANCSWLSQVRYYGWGSWLKL